MDRNLLKLCLFSSLAAFLLLFLAFFAIAPILCSLIGSLLYTLCYFILNEGHDIHNAQEFENRFWTIIAVLLSTAVIFAKDSPLAFGWNYPSLGFLGVVACGYGMHIWDRTIHRNQIGRNPKIKRAPTGKSRDELKALGIPIEEQIRKIDELISYLDQYFIPSTWNNFVKNDFMVEKEREILNIFQDAEKKVLNYLIGHSKLGLIVYKVKDHHKLKNRTKLIELLCINRVSLLSVHSKVLVLDALQMMKLPANDKAENCVRNIIENTKQDDLSDLKTLTDAKGDYFCMTKLIYDDIKSQIVRDKILNHFKNQANIQKSHMKFNTKKSKERKKKKFWRKVLSDIDDTLTCSAGSYPAGIDKRYGKKVVYPGVLGFYRELDLGTDGPEKWPEHIIGNLVFLSARPHIFKDISEKINFAKFEKMVKMGMHTTPSLLSGDINSGWETLYNQNFEPLAQKKFDNFRKYVSIYPEFRHVFIGDNGQGDVKAAELMVEAFPEEVEAIYIHVVQDISLTHGYSPEKWSDKHIRPFFFRTYPEAALDAAKRNFIRSSGLRRICSNTIEDFKIIQAKDWPSEKHKLDRRDELNQALWSCNEYLKSKNEATISLIETERLWRDGEKVRTPYGNAIIVSFDNAFDLYEVLLDWRSIDDQILDYEKEKKEKQATQNEKSPTELTSDISERPQVLETVYELDDEENIITPKPSTEEDTTLTDYSKASIGDELNVSSSSPKISTQEKCNVIVAKIQGRCISKYQPPVLPLFSKDDGNKKVFSFWGSNNSSKGKIKTKALFSEGDKCSTPYGPGTVLTYREETGIVVMKMTGWSATCYLSDAIVKSEGGYFKNFFRKINTSTPNNKSSVKKLPSPKETESNSSKDCILFTPFGEGRIVPPKRDDPKVTNELPTALLEYSTVKIQITSWTLANNTHPTLYCTEETTLDWKRNDNDERSKNSGGILSAFKSLGKIFTKKKVPSEIKVPTFERFYMDGAAVTTPFGDGRVKTFREEDGFYEVTLLNWKLANNMHAKVFLRDDSLTYQKALGCQEGNAVLTCFGSAGILESVQPRTGVHIVTIPVAGMVCYLQPKDVIRPLNAIVGDDVLTQYGNGQIRKYRVSDGVYEISLLWGATLYAQSEGFERDSNIKERSALKMRWVFRLFFSQENKSNKFNTGGSQRSRSNSVTSLRTQN